jgi:hypothetical protein
MSAKMETEKFHGLSAYEREQLAAQVGTLTFLQLTGLKSVQARLG